MPNLIRNPFMKAPRLYVDNEQKAQNLKKHMPNYQICHYLPDADKFNGSFAKPTLNWDLP
jgi:hypothetical protein